MDDGDDFFVTEAAPDFGEQGALDEFHEDIRDASGVVRVRRVPINLGRRNSAGPQVIDGSHLAGVVIAGGMERALRPAARRAEPRRRCG